MVGGRWEGTEQCCGVGRCVRERQEQTTMDPALKSQLRKIADHLRDEANCGEVWRAEGTGKAESSLRNLESP